MADPLAVLAGLVQFGRALTGSYRRETIAEAALDFLWRLFEPDAVAVLLDTGTPARFEIAAQRGAEPRRQDDPLIADTLHTQRVVRSERPARVGAPLVAAGHTMGMIGVWGKDADTFDESSELAVTTVAAALTLALQNARLVQLLSTGKREWEQTVDAIAQAICIVDARRAVRRANRTFAELVQAPITTIAGRPLKGLFPPAWEETIARALATPGEAGAGEVRTGLRIHAVSALAIRDEDDGATVLVLEDVTERRRLQEQLIQSEKMSAIGQLIAGVAHELNNPLASVLGFADFLVESGETPERLGEPLKVIQQEAGRAASVVKNLLTFARRQEQGRRSLEVASILERTVNLLRNQLIGLGVESRLASEPDLPLIEGSPNQLQQVFVNLVNNAAQAIASTGRPGTVTIHARPWLDGVAVDVADDGPGIPPELHERIFEPFFTTKPQGEGTGLGLSICQGIVREHGGRLTVRSSPSAGAVFTVELPGTPKVALAEAVVPHARETVGRVLVVDDEPHILHYMRATLEAWGHTVDVASDGQEALRRALGGEYDVIITDIRMPALGGRELYERLRREAPRLAQRVVFSTGDTVRDDTLTFLEGTGRPCLHKPFKLAELKSTLSAALEASR